MKRSMTENPTVIAYMKNAERVGATQVDAAVAKEWEGKGGKVLEACGIAPLLEGDYPTPSRGYVKHAFDPESKDRLWADSLKLVGL